MLWLHTASQQTARSLLGCVHCVIGLFLPFVRHADVDADGARMDGMNGADAAGVNGEGVDMDGVKGRRGAGV